MTKFVQQRIIKASLVVLLCFIALLQQTTSTSVAAQTATEHSDIDEIANYFQENEEQHVEHNNRNLQRITSVSRVAFIDATRNRVLGYISEGMNIVLSDYGLTNPNSLNFLAVTAGTIGSVKFTATGNVTANSIDNTREYALCGNYGSYYLTCSNLKFGTMTLTVQPFSSRNAIGRAGRRVTITFSIVATMGNPTTAPQTPISIPSNIPTAAPQNPTGTPIVPMTSSPTSSPIMAGTTMAPVSPNSPPTRTPTKSPTAAPIRSPTTAPIRSPTTAPIRNPTTAPIRKPTTAPIRNPTTAPIRKPTTAPVPAVTSAYEITLSLVGSGLTQSDVTTFQNAANRWKQIVVGDVPNINSAGLSLPFTGCTAPATIDDLLICGKIGPIDGVSNVLGYAGPTWVRSSSKIPLMGQMVFDSADVEGMRQRNTLYPVILHEMGHVMGIGTMWEGIGVTGTSAENCPYRGVNGNREYSTVSGCTGRALPTELDGGDGTRCGHFDEECFKDELMTGYATGTMPISRLTVATLQDIGYTVSYAAADPFTVANLNPTCVCNARNLRDRQLLKIVKPIDTTGMPSSSSRKRKLSNSGFQKAREFGKKILVRGRKRFHKDNESSTMSAAAAVAKQKKEIYVGGDFITVIYNDGANGIFGVVVTMADL
jgi:Leishmanolysin